MHNPIYQKSPAAFQNALLALRGWARGAVWQVCGLANFERSLEHTAQLNATELLAWKQGALLQTLQHASRQVPHYEGLDPRELQAWPLLDKQMVLAAGRRALARNVSCRLTTSTSGTTGSPMKIARTPKSAAFEQALVRRQLNWAGWRRGDRRVWLRGDAIVPLERAAPPFWRHAATERMLMCSSFHLSEQTADHYLKAIEAFNPVIIQAYPASVTYLARWLLMNGRVYKGTALRGIVTSSERMSMTSSRDCAKAFGVSVFDWYGQAERVAAVGTCEQGNRHIIEDASWVELLPRPNGTSAIVGTSFANRAMPFVRYVTGDSLVLADPSYVCPCGRPFRVVDQLMGRDADVIVTSAGRPHVMLDFIFEGVGSLQEGQIVQTGSDEIEINVVLRPGRALDEVQIVLDRARQRFGPGVDVRLNRLDAIPRTASGKFSAVVPLVTSTEP